MSYIIIYGHALFKKAFMVSLYEDYFEGEVVKDGTNRETHPKRIQAQITLTLVG